MIAPTAARLAIALCRTGRAEEATVYLKQVEAQQSWRAAAVYGRNFVTMAQAEIALRVGDLDAALEHAIRVESATAASGELNHGYALLLLAEARFRSGQHGQALEACDAALAFGEERGMRPLLARKRRALQRSTLHWSVQRR